MLGEASFVDTFSWCLWRCFIVLSLCFLTQPRVPDSASAKRSVSGEAGSPPTLVPTPVPAIADVQPGDLFSEGLIHLSEAARYCPHRNGRKVHINTIVRWVKFGSRGVYLEALDTPSGLCTTLPALRRFFASLTAARNLPRQRREPSVMEEYHKAVEAELARRFRI